MSASSEPTGSVPRYEVRAMAHSSLAYEVLTRFDARASAVCHMENAHTRRGELAYIYDRRRGIVVKTNRAALEIARKAGLEE